MDGPTPEQQRLAAAAMAAADPTGLGRLTSDQLHQVAVSICAALDRDPRPDGVPLLSAALPGQGLEWSYANARRVAAAVATAVYCPEHAGIGRRLAGA